MANWLYLLLAAAIGYLIGAIPFGYIYVKLVTGKDIRTIESGRTGGTNAGRAAGGWVGWLTGLSDMFKATAAVLAATALVQNGLAADWLPYARALAGLCAVIGHNWSVYVGFAGGAGLTPNVGWATAIWGWLFPIAFVMLIAIFYITGMASVVTFSISATISVVLGIRYWMGVDPSPAYLLASLVTLAMIGWSLRPNFQRILNGTERRVGPAAKRHANKRA